MRIEAKLKEMGLTLPEPVKPPPGAQLSFSWVRVRGDKAYVSDHGPLNQDGYEAARLTALAVLGSLKRELSELDRVSAWLVVHGMVNATQGFKGTTNVINGFSDLILEPYGPEAGMYARTAVGMATLPLGLPATIAAEIEVRS